MPQQYEYRIVPAPTRKARFTGMTGSDDAFSLTVSDVVNSQARDGWEYLRADKLAETRGVWPFRRSRPSRDLLVFRRGVDKSLERAKADAEEAARVRARRVRRDDLMALVESGARKIRVERPDTTVAAE